MLIYLCFLIFSISLNILSLYQISSLREAIKRVKSEIDSSVKEILDQPPLDEEQVEFKKAIDKKWQLALEQQRRTFSQSLQEAYQKAEDSIDFEKIKYKKTIAKKRKIAKKIINEEPDSQTWKDITED